MVGFAFAGWLMRILVRTCRRLLLGRSASSEVVASDNLHRARQMMRERLDASAYWR
jgi:hypothetical protein